MRNSVLAATLTVAAWMGLAATPSQADLFVTSGSTNAVFRYDGTTGAFISAISGGGLLTPRGMAFGPDGNFYVASFNTNNVLRYNGRTGAFMDIFASGASPIAIAFTPVPEPSALTLIGIGALILGVSRWRHRPAGIKHVELPL